jgi:hypothetical protein
MSVFHNFPHQRFFQVLSVLTLVIFIGIMGYVARFASQRPSYRTQIKSAEMHAMRTEADSDDVSTSHNAPDLSSR